MSFIVHPSSMGSLFLFVLGSLCCVGAIPSAPGSPALPLYLGQSTKNWSEVLGGDFKDLWSHQSLGSSDFLVPHPRWVSGLLLAFHSPWNMCLPGNIDLPATALESGQGKGWRACRLAGVWLKWLSSVLCFGLSPRTWYTVIQFMWRGNLGSPLRGSRERAGQRGGMGHPDTVGWGKDLVHLPRL